MSRPRTPRQKAIRMNAARSAGIELLKEAGELANQLASKMQPGDAIDIGGGQEVVMIDPFVGSDGQPKLQWKRTAVARFDFETRTKPPVEVGAP